MTKKIWILSAGALLAAGLLAWIWLGRDSTETAGIHRVDANADIPPAAVVRAERHNVGSTLAIAGEFKPFQDVDVHAKVAGYIRQIYVDVGDHVKEGQMLAVLEVPELAAQLTGAEAAVRAAQEQVRKALGDLQRAKSSHARRIRRMYV
jgi:multidrug efflux pump subunit AcrA (membrane-fusion protein)